MALMWPLGRRVSALESGSVVSVAGGPAVEEVVDAVVEAVRSGGPAVVVVVESVDVPGMVPAPKSSPQPANATPSISTSDMPTTVASHPDRDLFMISSSSPHRQ
jgi:hypothetical protein